jgi:hypothetical protein
MAKPTETMEGDQEAVQQVLSELQARPPGTPLKWEEAMAYVRRMGKKMPAGWTSADSIRELRGPLPDEDPDFVNAHRH